ncbi:MAG: hypothetical protein M1823_003036 [Watsoniomyces obsoletus]|nr:MAG: hypothetical protein M1823_003036 [Watsoniomyces obsoletus]
MPAKRKAGNDIRKKGEGRSKKLKRQAQYDSDDSEVSVDININGGVSKAVNTPQVKRMDNEEEEHSLSAGEASIDDHDADKSMAESEDSSFDSGSDTDTHPSTGHKPRKRDDPEVFATSLSKILNSKLSSSKRADPVLARSKVAAAANQELVDARLEAKARHKLREEKKAQLDRGRVKDVLGVEGNDDKVNRSAAEVMELERMLKKTAQRGVVKLFNAVRAAQVKGEQAEREAKKAGIVSMKEREERVNEMSKQGFLDLIASGGGSKG